MILSSSIIQYLFYTFLICYNFDITSVSATTKKAAGVSSEPEKLSVSQKNPETTALKPTKPSTAESMASILGIIASPANDTISEEISYEEDEESLNEAATALDIIVTPPTITMKISVPTITDTMNNKINSTKMSQNSKSPLPIILGFIFGSLGIIVLITSICIYVLIKRGYIKVFNQPRTRIKDIERTRIVDSSSKIGNTSPSRR